MKRLIGAGAGLKISGWLDAGALRYSARVNGLTEIALTKLDILSSFDPIKIAVAYEYEGQSRMKALQLRDGSAFEGHWSTPFPLGSAAERASILTGDELFNEGPYKSIW